MPSPCYGSSLECWKVGCITVSEEATEAENYTVLKVTQLLRHASGIQIRRPGQESATGLGWNVLRESEAMTSSYTL